MEYRQNRRQWTIPGYGEYNRLTPTDVLTVDGDIAESAAGA